MFDGLKHCVETLHGRCDFVYFGNKAKISRIQHRTRTYNLKKLVENISEPVVEPNSGNKILYYLTYFRTVIPLSTERVWELASFFRHILLY